MPLPEFNKSSVSIVSKTSLQLIEIIDNQEADVPDLVDIIESDKRLAKEVTTWGQSPYYSKPNSIHSVHDAIVRVLGFDMVRNIALALSLTQKVRNNKSSQHWQNAVYTAAIVEALICTMHRDFRPNFGTAYLSALLHNFSDMMTDSLVNQKSISFDEAGKSKPSISQISDWNSIPIEVRAAIREQNNVRYNGDHWKYALLLHTAQEAIRNTDTLTPQSTTLKRLKINAESSREAIALAKEEIKEIKNISQRTIR